MTDTGDSMRVDAFKFLLLCRYFVSVIFSKAAKRLQSYSFCAVFVIMKVVVKLLTYLIVLSHLHRCSCHKVIIPFVPKGRIIRIICKIRKKYRSRYNFQVWKKILKDSKNITIVPQHRKKYFITHGNSMILLVFRKFQ